MKIKAVARHPWGMVITLRAFTSADLEWVCDCHGTLYAQAEGFDDSFGALVRQILTDFVAEHDADFERGFIAVDGEGRRLGSIFCVRHDAETAKLRLFLLVPEARGRGIGRQLLEACTDYARDCGYRRMTLWTHESHRAACALYARSGWSLLGSKDVVSFGQPLVEQHWERPL
ncbi:TDP-fucosamine acetyltransferase [Roseivivax sp. THAF40]|nr:TDP-fucosamine acetyltransferase [Roseivivax sp. THAF197b]QFT45762.1 TDP-fucosamine acetyltransferase [Roseivivax sp. THAF40]